MSLFFAILFLITTGVFIFLWRRELEINGKERLARALLESEVANGVELKLRTDMLNRLANGIEDGLLIISPELRLMYMNRSAVRFLPFATASVGRPLLESVRDHRMVDLVSKALSEGHRVQEEIIQTFGDTSGRRDQRVISLEVVLLKDEVPNSPLISALVILRDETEKRALEKIRRDFVANASHELRTPLSIITGYLENLLSGDLSSPVQQKRAYDLMNKHAQRLARIVEDMLLISRLESGEGDVLRAEEVDIKACVMDVVGLLSHVITTQNAVVNVSVKRGTSVKITGDRYYWEQIFFNLIENALKENPARGLKVSVKIAEVDGDLEVQVCDDGVGIPGADLPFVFKRFYRVEGHRSKQVKGTGLGLSIVKRAVEAHQGTISLRSQPGIETVFTIRIGAARRLLD
jgi:two-component system, OmpR family, phosphate regulon sensor histidine kinase PhoR